MIKMALILIAFTTSIYSLHFTTIQGVTNSFNAYQGKQILIVTIATNSPDTAQIAGLQQLQQQYGSNVKIIAFPSNDFNHEPRTNTEIAAFCENNYGTTFTIAQKGAVIGANKQAIFHWLASVAENGIMNAPVVGDYQKFLIDKDGNLDAVFNASVQPMSSTIINAINNN
jgi:glutathione peroxidase